jgi:hypothetical protein
LQTGRSTGQEAFVVRRSDLKPLAMGVLLGVAGALAIRAGAQQPPAPAAPPTPAPAPAADKYQISAADKQTVFVLDKQTGAVYEFAATADRYWTPTQGFSIPQGVKYLEQGPQGDQVAPGRH